MNEQPNCISFRKDSLHSVASIVGIICQRFGVLCSQAGFSPRWANVYIECITFISIRCVVFFTSIPECCHEKTHEVRIFNATGSSIALYGLLLFYGLTSDELKGRRPMAKFLAIKLIVMFTFYQSFVVR